MPSERVHKRRSGYVPFMDDMLCDISAFRYHRIPPQVLAIMPDLPDSVDDPRREHLCEHPLVTHFLGTPLHVLAQGSCGRKGDRIVRHVWNGERPFDSMRQTEFGLDVASPLFTLLTLASSVSNERLIMCMYEMCGTFAVCKIAPQVKSALEQAYGGRWGDARSGWENVKDTSGNPTDLWKRPPLIELSELTEYVDKIPGLRGAKSFTRAAKCITGVAASPLEVQASMLFGLTRLRGGEGLRLTNNVEIRMTRSARLISGLDRRYADILLANKDGSRECLVECQGKAIHGSIESKISDSDRTTALQAMGYPVILMTYGQLADSDAFRVVMELIMAYLDVPLKDKTPRQQELERRLREEIFIDWAGM